MEEGAHFAPPFFEAAVFNKSNGVMALRVDKGLEFSVYG